MLNSSQLHRIDFAIYRFGGVSPEEKMAATFSEILISQAHLFGNSFNLVIGRPAKEKDYAIHAHSTRGG